MLYDRLEHFAGLGDFNNTFLRHVGTIDLYDSNSTVLGSRICCHIKVDRCGIQHIPIRSRNLNQRKAFTVFQFLRGNEHTVLGGVEGVDFGIFGIGIAHHDFVAVRIVQLERCAGIRNCQAGFRIGFNHLDITLEIRVVCKVAIDLPILADEHIKVRQKLSAFPALDLMNGVNAIRHILGLRKSVFVTN